MKKISVAITGTEGEGEMRDLEIESGTTAGDILSSLNLNEYDLLPEENGTPFARTEVVYGKVEDEDKLFAIPKADVGI